MNLTKTLVLNVVSIVTIASLITACCGLPAREEDGGQQPTTTVEAYPAPTEVASGPVEVVSERELTTEEFFQAVEGDESFADVYALAAEQGYTEQGGAAEVILSNATVLSGLALGSPQDEAIIAIQAASGERNSSLLLRYENETLVLYDRHGRLELTEQGVAVFDAAGDPIGETELPESWRPPALASALQTEQEPCITGPMHEIYTCLGRFFGTVGVGAGCAGALAVVYKACPFAFTPAAPAAAPACAAALLVATGSCAFGAGCVFWSGDDEPTLTPTRCEKAQTPPTLICEPRGGREVVVEHQDWVCGVKVEDDRVKAPKPYEQFTVLCDYSHTAKVTDCGGNTAELPLLAPPCQVVAYCDSGVCEEGRCLAPATGEMPEPISSGVCSTPGAWCVVESRFDLPEIPEIPRNEVKIAFPVDGGPVSGEFYAAFIIGVYLFDEVCVERFDYIGTLSGHFDPESGRLEGTVDDWSIISEVLEGCEDSESEFGEPGAVSWWATYDWATGELEGEWVDPAEEEVTLLRGISVSEEPSNPLE